MSERAMRNNRYSILNTLSGLAGATLNTYIQGRNRQQLQNIGDALVERGQTISRNAFNGISRALRRAGGTNAEAREVSNRVQRENVRQRTAVAREGNRNVEEEEEEEEREEGEIDDGDEEEMEDGMGGGGGGGSSKPSGKSIEWMITPTNRWIGPGIYPTNPNDKQEFTIETPLLFSGNIELIEGQVHNMLAQKFTSNKGDVDWSTITYKPQGVRQEDFMSLLETPRELNFNYYNRMEEDWTFVAAGDLNRPENKATAYYNGYVNHRGHKEGTIGSIRVKLPWQLTTKKHTIRGLLLDYRYIRLKAMDIIISDMYAWGVDQVGQNKTHAITPDIATILEVPVEVQREGIVEANLQILTGEHQGDGIITNFGRRLISYPVTDNIIKNQKIPREYQTGWKGGDYRKSLKMKEHWSSTKHIEDDLKIGDNEVGIEMVHTYIPPQIQGKVGLFDNDLNIDPHKGSQYTLHDMDVVRPDNGYVMFYTPYTADVIRPSNGGEFKQDVKDASATAGGLGLGNEINKQILLFVRRKIPSATMKQFVKYTLQIRETWEVADSRNMLTTNITTYANMPGAE